MNPWYFLLLGILVIALAIAVPRMRLRRALKAPFPDEWVTLLEQNIGVYPRLPMALRKQLRQRIKRFLHTKHFSGAGGLEIDDEIRVTIAAQACMLWLSRKGTPYPGLRYIIVYPAAFVVSRKEAGEGGVVSEARRGLLGESWSSGKVILAWDDVVKGARNFVDGSNVVLHEFAHQLDTEDGSADGAPLLAGESCYRSWAAALSKEFRVLQKKARTGGRSVMDHYGATNPAEFFAVATESFFEKPEAMAERHGELFTVLHRFYGVDPREWQ
ncbi:MAG: M90 family metallopeptidase [Xanthomonadales bacterium]|jgi:Mlc titration factor MtfA (ptsG expression regulator)|nr:M90 family metallopeptidase [Xanthomonadales bacterium]